MRLGRRRPGRWVDARETPGACTSPEALRGASTVPAGLDWDSVTGRMLVRDTCSTRAVVHAGL